jgi:hypothetical protein
LHVNEELDEFGDEDVDEIDLLFAPLLLLLLLFVVFNDLNMSNWPGAPE